MLTRREDRVIRAFRNCIAHGEFTPDYAVTLIEDDQRYGWLSDGAKQAFYAGPEEETPPVCADGADSPPGEGAGDGEGAPEG